MTDFSTYTMRYKATEHYAEGYVLPAALLGTKIIENPYGDLGQIMARVATPYAPCTDIIKVVWWQAWNHDEWIAP